MKKRCPAGTERKGCRQFESYLLAQERSWYDFLMDALVDGGVMKRLDLAINDHTGMLDIPELTENAGMRNVYRCSVPLSPMLPANWSSMRNRTRLVWAIRFISVH